MICCTNGHKVAGADEAVEEEPELLDGAYRVISESTTEEVLKPPEDEREVNED